MKVSDFPMKALQDELKLVTEIIAFTALSYDKVGAHRLCSSHPQLFSEAGFKSFLEAPTMKKVKETGEPIITDGIEAIKNGFPDWEKIYLNGCDAIVNLPVCTESGELVGQLNLMGKSGAFNTDTLDQLKLIANHYAEYFMPPSNKETAECV
ncbi:MAG: GAF domain-containing protein [Methylocystaceae bacterium]|nr:GAF domain-containing protein [Methylocystaceae bacterium]